MPRSNAKTRKYKNRMKKGRKTMRGGVTSSQREIIKNARAFWKTGATVKPVEKRERSSLKALQDIKVAQRRSKFTIGKKQGLSRPSELEIPEKKASSSSHYFELAAPAPTSASKRSLSLSRNPPPHESVGKNTIVAEKTASQIKREANEARKEARANRIKALEEERAALPNALVKVVEISSSEVKRRITQQKEDKQKKEDEQKEAELLALEAAAKKLKEEADAKKEINIQQQNKAADLLADLDAFLYKETNPSIKERLKRTKAKIRNFFKRTRKVKGQKSNSSARKRRERIFYEDPTQPHHPHEIVKNPLRLNSS